MSRYLNHNFLSFLILSLGIIILGWFIYAGIVRFKESERVVTVKGLSEREVSADRVIWPLVFKSASNDLTSLYSDIEKSNSKIIAFLESNGLSREEITVSPISVIDTEAERYSSGSYNKFRYKTTSVITVASDKVDKVRALMSKQGDLLKDGIALTTGDYEYSTIFSFSKLNDVKPEMVAEATNNGRMTAEKFAADSDSKLGKIRTATQGQFSISDRDANTPHIKVIRVVTTIEYFLKD